MNDDFSTDSEVQENEDDQEMKKDENQENITSLPFISRGEAVENCKMKFNNNNRSKKRTKSLDKQPKNDNEFMNILKNIAQGGREEDDGNETDISNKSDDEEEDNENITARKIAEDVINRRLNNSNRTTAVDHVISTSVNENEENDNDKIEEEEDAIMQEIQNEDLIQEQAVEAAIPNISKKLDHFISIIDQLENDNKKLTNTNKNDITENVSLIEDSDTEESDDITRYEDDINEDEDSNNIDNKQQIIEEIKRINENDRDGKYLKVVYSNSSNHIGWNDEMIRFYDQSWGGENFSVPNIRRLMFNAHLKWIIHNGDRYPKPKKFSHMKCFNCCEFGHNQMRCPKPKREIVCYMCGEKGHKEPRCRNTICLRCGSKTGVFMKYCSACLPQNNLTCPICKLRGHSIDLCPDKWRRYHSTTIANEFPNKNVNYNKRKFCCICAGRGHLAENCRYSERFSQYPPIASEIKSHAKSYQDNEITNSLAPNVIAYNLFYEPNDQIRFDFSTNSLITNRQYYWRFLNAVGLKHILLKKEIQ